MKGFILALALILPTAVFSRAEHKCPENKDCFRGSELLTDPISKSLRKTLNEYIRFTGQESATVDDFGIRPYLSHFHEKFTVLKIQEGDFGGYWVNIILSPQKMTRLLIWIYEVDENEFLIRSLEEIPLSKEDLKSWERLRLKRYAHYWL